ncbi:D-alanyl-D-alanine carboxypeptidase [Rossellomorea aquimaris]|uniref:D-alanyl-D-alanine carboxypeptidase family protein n=1 Tax=Rossellomorea aquimaris TaxID=189382 RepID=UPI001CD32E5E|nr:D-alanyl-D-alanine carboxypeptidase family protein [Rossellomorea aquimaris]MCA1053949.1 D-alanyl-D-alanine carboxypeptidase [Rossellomorea aquimaris]
MKKQIMLILLLVSWVLSPITSSAETNSTDKPDHLFSRTAVLLDSGTGSILYAKGAHKKMNPASITKIATAIYALEHTGLDDKVTVSTRAADTEGSTVYLLPGESISMRQLMEGMMVNSGNDAAVAIAEHTEGSVEGFMKKLNVFLKEEVGVKDTHFVNPHGLYDEDHYTTAYDMAKITSYALKNDTFKALFDIDSVDWKSEGWKTTLYNHHKMVKGELPYPEVNGGKNGFVPEANHTLVTSAENDDLSVVAVTMDAQSKRAIYSDTKSLLDYGLQHFTRSYVSKDSSFQAHSKSYELPADFHYTKRMNEEVVEEVNDHGLLTIYDGEHEEIASTQLEPSRSTGVGEHDVLATSNGMDEGKWTDPELFYPVFLYMIILVIAGISMFRQNEQDSLSE